MIKKKINFIIDVETVGMKDKHIINLGLVIGDNKGNILEKHEWNIQENIIRGYRMPEPWRFYLGRVVECKDAKQVATFKDLFNDFVKILNDYKMYDIEFWSYNANFDYNAFMSNLEFAGIELNKKQRNFFNYRWFCIWNYATNVLMNRSSYRLFAKKHNLYSEKGNMKTSAEVCYRYITNDIEFIEDHTGLSDALIEYKILMYCKRQRKKAHKERKDFVWKDAQEKRDDYKKTGWL
jgi:hypothetical protein